MAPRYVVPLFLERLEDRRVLSAAPWAIAATPAFSSAPADSAASFAPGNISPAGTTAFSPSAEATLSEFTRQMDAEGTATAPSEARADHAAALLGQAVFLPPGSPGVGPALRLYAEDAANSLNDDSDLTELDPPFTTLEDSDSNLVTAPEFAPVAPPSLPDDPNLDLPSLPMPELEATTASRDEGSARVDTAVGDATTRDEEQPTTEAESTTADSALPVVDESSEEAPLEPVFLEGGTLVHSDQILASLAAGDLAALRRALEAMLFELGKFDPNGADVSTRLALLLWLSAAAAATTAGSLIVRRHFKEANPDQAPRPDVRSRPLAFDPLLA